MPIFRRLGLCPFPWLFYELSEDLWPGQGAAIAGEFHRGFPWGYPK